MSRPTSSEPVVAPAEKLRRTPGHGGRLANPVFSMRWVCRFATCPITRDPPDRSMELGSIASLKDFFIGARPRCLVAASRLNSRKDCPLGHRRRVRPRLAAMARANCAKGPHATDLSYWREAPPRVADRPISVPARVEAPRRAFDIGQIVPRGRNGQSPSRDGDPLASGHDANKV